MKERGFKDIARDISKKDTPSKTVPSSISTILESVGSFFSSLFQNEK